MSGRLVLVRHGQSHGNVERRLDTRPPGAETTLTQPGKPARDHSRAPLLPRSPVSVAGEVNEVLVSTTRSGPDAWTSGVFA